MAAKGVEAGASFVAGDVVRLISGGPEMTVEAVPADETSDVVCVWSGARDGAFCRERIAVEALTHRAPR